MLKYYSIRQMVALMILVLALLSIGSMISARQSPVGSANNGGAALDWYFAHDHTVLDGDNNVLSIATRRGESQWAPLDWYLVHDHAILDGDNNVLSR